MLVNLNFVDRGVTFGLPVAEDQKYIFKYCTGWILCVEIGEHGEGANLCYCILQRKNEKRETLHNWHSVSDRGDDETWIDQNDDGA